MNSSQYAGDLDRQAPGVGSIRRARERAQAGVPREDFDTFVSRMGQPVPPQQQAQQAQPPREAPRARPQPTGPSPIGVAISKPTPAAQWPLAGPLAAPVATDGQPYHPPPGRSQRPQRPPRPSNVPSILDGSKIQDPSPSVFNYTVLPSDSPTTPVSGGGRPNMNRQSDLSNTQQSSSSASRPSTVSSMGSIPDFPIPVAQPVAIPVPPPMPPVPPPRRSVNLGPPPSARRGASSFYSNASFVSPIPEESPRSRSHASFASSAAMPESWGTASSPSLTPDYARESDYYEDIIPEDATEASVAGHGYEDYGEHTGDETSPDGDDERRLVRSASVGKRAKAALVTTAGTGSRATPSMLAAAAAAAAAPNTGSFQEGTGYIDTSSSSSVTAPSNTARRASSITADNILEAYDAASVIGPANSNRRMSASPPTPALSNPNTNNALAGEGARQYSRLSAIRRPPRLDMDAVRDAEARGSMTSLPDLIRRATRLAASLERGRRPASRVDDFSMSPGMFPKDWKESSIEKDKHQSGLSDMLAAFPPPAQPRPSLRQSLRQQVGSWPVPMMGASRLGSLSPLGQGPASGKGQQKRKGRRCCGLPLWGFLVILFVVLIVIAAAVVIPVELLIVQKNKNSSTALEACDKELTCLNGGTNVITDQGACACICTNGFTGTDCSNTDEDGCTTTTLTSTTSGNTTAFTNATLGEALPRLIALAEANFSISLSGTQLLAMFNAANLSCTAENALVTFDGTDGSDDSDGSTSTTVSDLTSNAVDTGDNGVSVAKAAIMTVTVMRGVDTTVTLAATTETVATGTDDGEKLTLAATPSSTTTTTVTVTPTTTVGVTSTSTSKSTTTASSTGESTGTSSSTSATATSTFMVTDDVRDFARVAVLYILQEESLAKAETAQTALQKFFSSASDSDTGVTVEDARNLTLSNGNTIDLESFQLQVTAGLGGITKMRRDGGGRAQLVQLSQRAG